MYKVYKVLVILHDSQSLQTFSVHNYWYTGYVVSTAKSRMDSQPPSRSNLIDGFCDFPQVLEANVRKS